MANKNCKPHYKGKSYESFDAALNAIGSNTDLEATASEYYNLYRKSQGQSTEEGSQEDLDGFEKYVSTQIGTDPRFNQPDFDRESEQEEDDLSDDEVSDAFGFDEDLNFEDTLDRRKSDNDHDFAMTKTKKKLTKEGLGDFLVIDGTEVFNSYKQSKAIDSIFESVVTALQTGEANSLDDAFSIAKKVFAIRRKAYNLATVQEKFDSYSEHRKKQMAINDTSDADEFYLEFDKVLRNWPQFERFTKQKMKALFGVVDGKKPLSSTKASSEVSSDEQLEGFEGLESVLEKVNFDDGASFAINHKDTATARVKAFLAVQRDSERSYLNLPTFIPFDTVYDELQMVLAGKAYNDISEMKRDIMIASASKPYLENLVTVLEKSSKQLQKGFFVTFSKQHQAHIFTDFIQKTIKDEVFVQYRNIESNRNDVVKTIRKKWLESQKRSPMVMNKNGELVINPETAQKFDAEVTRLSEEKDVSTEDLQKLLALTGVEISTDALNYFKEKSGKLTKVAFKNHFKKGGAFYYLAKSFVGDSETAEVDENIPLSVNNPLISGENTSMDILAKIEAEFTDSIFSNSFRNVEGKTIYSYGLNTHFSLMMSRLLENDANNEHTNNLSKISFSRNSEWLRRLKEEPEFRDAFGFYYLDGFKKQRSNQKGKTRGQQSEREMEVQMLSLFQNKDAEKAYFVYPTVSDKTTTPVMSALRHRSAIKINKDGKLSIGKDGISGVNTAKALMNVFQSEVDRIENYRFPDKGEEYSSYDVKKNSKGEWVGGALNFYLFPSLNELVKVSYNEETKSFQVGFDKKEVSNAIKNEVISKAEAKVEKWKSLGLLKKADPNKKDDKDVSFMDVTYIKRRFFPKGAIQDTNNAEHQALIAALDMEINYALSNTGIRQLISGDPATHFKGNVEKTLDEYTKRLAKDIAPGMDGAFDKPSYSMLYLQDFDEVSKHREEYAKLLGVDKYSELSTTDAQEYTTIQEHLDVMYAYEKLSEEEYNSMTKKIKNKEDFSEGDLRIILQPMKPVQVYNKADIARDVNMPIYIKSSSFPLIPQLTKGLEIDKLRVAMEGESGNDINRAAYKSAAKLGSSKLANIWNKDGTIKEGLDLSENVNQLSRTGFRIQQEVPYKEDKTKITTVSQMNKLLFEGILHIDGMPQLREDKEAIRMALFEKGLTKFQKKTGIEIDLDPKTGLQSIQIKDIKKLQKALQEEAISRGYPLNDIAALELNKKGDGFVMPLSMSTSASKIESILMSMVTNNLVKHKMPGKSYVQGSSAGFLTGATKGKSWNDLSESEVNSIVFAEGYNPDEGLKYVRNENGVIQPAQMILPFYFRGKNKEMLDITKYTKKVNGKTVIDMEKIPAELLKIIGARIPNQGHSSMLPIEVVGFLPESMGDLIIVPGEITKQMGADFDVDKLYTYQYLYDIDENGKLTKKSKVKRKTKSKKDHKDSLTKEEEKEKADDIDETMSLMEAQVFTIQNKPAGPVKGYQTFAVFGKEEGRLLEAKTKEELRKKVEQFFDKAYSKKAKATPQEITDADDKMLRTELQSLATRVENGTKLTKDELARVKELSDILANATILGKEDVDVVREPVKMGDITFNPEQTAAYYAMKEWLRNPQGSYMLEGYAGTGKTTIINKIVQELKEEGTSIGVSAPTHQAVSVIEDSTKSQGHTVHSLLGLKPNEELENFDPESPEFKLGDKPPKMKDYKVVVIDEASMINSKVYDYLVDTARSFGTKLIFMGDPAQIPPVGESLSPAFTATANKSLLTKVERQAGDNPLGPVYDAIRSNIASKIDMFPHQTELNDKGEGIEFITSDNKDAWVDQMVESFKNDPKGTKLITWTNKSVQAYNKKIRSLLRPGETQPLVAGDQMIMKKTVAPGPGSTWGEPLHNSEQLEIADVSEIKDGFGVKYQTLTFETEVNGETLKRTLNVLYPDPQNAMKYISELSRLASEAKKNGGGSAWGPYYALAKGIVGSTPGRNFSIDYGYAITVHKAQGSTYNNVFVNEVNIDRNPDAEERNKIKYVASSRPRKKAIFLTNKSPESPMGQPVEQIESLEESEQIVDAQTQPTDDLLTQANEILENAAQVEEEAGEEIVEETEDTLKNDYIDIHWQVLTHPEVLPRILNPLDKEGEFSVADEADMIDNIRNKDKAAESQLFTSTNIETFIQNKGGKDGVGVFSLASTFNAYIQGYDLNLGVVVYENGKKKVIPITIENFTDDNNNAVRLNELSNPGNNPNGDVASNISDVQSAAVDNAKNQHLDKINLNMATFPAAIALNQLTDAKGKNLHIQYTTRFFSQQGIKEYVREVSNLIDSTTDEFYSDSSKEAIFRVMESFASNIKNEKLRKNHIPTKNGEEYSSNMLSNSDISMSPKFLLDQIKNEGEPNDAWYVNQIEMLKVFQQLTDVGKEMQKISKALNTDSKGLDPSIFDVQDKIYRLDKLKDSPMIRNAEELVQSGELAKYASANFWATLFYKDLLLQNSDLTRSIIDTLGPKIGRSYENEKPLKTEDKIAIFNAIKSFLFTKEGMITGDVTSERRRLLMDTEDNKSLATRVQEAKESWGAKNHLLKRLTTDSSTTEGDPARVEYNAALAERFDETENVNAFIDLLGSPVEEQRKLGQDLVDYLFITSGIQGAKNFMKFIPTTYLVQSNIAKRINDMTWNSASEVELAFVRQFVQHNPQMLPAAPVDVTEKTSSFSLPEPKQGGVNTRTFSNDNGEKITVWVDAFMVRDEKANRFRIFMKDSLFSKSFTEVDVLGGPAGFTEYNATIEGKANDTMFKKNAKVSQKAEPTRKTKEEAKKEVYTPQVTKEGGTVVNKNPISNITETYGLKESDTKESVMTAVKKISEESTDPYNQALAKVLLANESFVENFNFFIDSTIEGRGSYKYEGDGKLGELRVNPDHFTDENGNFDSVAFEKTFIHELIHQETGSMINAHFDAVNAGKESPLSPEMQKAVKSLDAVRTIMYNNLTDIEKAEFEAFQNMSSDEKLASDLPRDKKYMYYALSRPTEFITQVLTSENFQRQLSSMEFNSKQSLLDRILQLFQDLFSGLKTSLGVKVDKTLLGEAVAASVNLMETANQHKPVVKEVVDAKSDQSLFPETRPSVPVTDGTQIEVRDFIHAKDKYSGMYNAKGKVRIFPLTDSGFKSVMGKAKKANNSAAFKEKYGEKYKIRINKTPMGYMLDVHQYKDTLPNQGLDYDLSFDDFEILDPSIEKTMELLNNRIKALERKKANSKSDKIVYQNRIDALKEQVKSLKEENSIAQVKLVADAQLDWAENLLKKPKLSHSEITEASNVIDAWGLVQEIFDEKHNKAFEKTIDSISNRATRLDKKRKEVLLDWAQKNVVMADNKKIAKEDLQVMKDTGAMRATFLDLSRVDNPAVQALSEWLHNAARDTNYEFTQLETQIAEAVSKLKNTAEYKNNGYDIFLQEGEDGKWTGGMVNRYSQSYYSERTKRLKKAKALGPRGWREYFNWKKENEVMVDSRVLFDKDTGEKLNDHVAKKHIKEMEDEFGKERTQEMIEQAYDLYQNYLVDRQATEEGFRADMASDLNEDKIKAMMNAWETEHSPRQYISNYKGQSIIKGVKMRGYTYTVSKPKKFKDSSKSKRTGWYDEKFETVENNPELLEFYNFYRGVMKEMRSNLPTYEEEKLQENFIPFVQQSVLKSFTTNGAKAGVAGMYSNFVDSLSEPDNVMVSADRDVKTGNINKRVPIRFIQKGDPDEQSTDIVKALELFTLMSLNYKHKTNVEDKALLMQRLVNEAAEQKTTTSGDSKKDTAGKMFRIYGSGALANTNKAVEHAINASLYGERRNKGTSTGILVSKQGLKESKRATELSRKIKLLRKKYNMNQITEQEYEDQAGPLEKELEGLGARNVTSVDVADFMIRMTQLKGMAFNIFSATSNITYGVASNFIHAAGQEDFTTKQAMTAWRIMLSSTSKSLGLDRAGLGDKTSKKINNLVRKFDILFEVNEAAHTGNTKSKEVSKSKNVFSKMSPYELQKRAEYFIQGMVMVAKMMNTTVIGKDGEISLWEAFDENGEIDTDKYGADLMKEWSGDINDNSQMKKFKKFRNSTIQLNKRLHGNYDPNSLPLAKKYVLGRIALQFRSWLAEGVATRFEAGSYDKQLDREVKGMYRSIYDVAMGEGLMAPLKHFAKVAMRSKDGLESLSPADLANFKKVLSEATWVMTLIALGLLLDSMAGDDDDDEKNKYRNMVLNQVYRVKSDLTFYDNPNSFEQILSNPIPLMRTVMDFQKAIGASVTYFTQPDDIDKRSEMTGERLMWKWMKAVPYFNQIKKYTDQGKKVMFK